MAQRIFGNIEADFVALTEDGQARGRATADLDLAALLEFSGVGESMAPVAPEFRFWLNGLRSGFDTATTTSRLFMLPSPVLVDVAALLDEIDGRGFEILVTNGRSDPEFSALDAVVPEGVAYTRQSALAFRAKLTDGSRSVFISVSVKGGIVDAIVDCDSRAGWDLVSEAKIGARKIMQPTLIREPPDAVRSPKLCRRSRTQWLERQLCAITGVDVGIIERRHLMREAGVVPASSVARFSTALARLYGVMGARETMFVLDESAPTAGGHFSRHVGQLLEEWQIREPLGLRLDVPSILDHLKSRTRGTVSREAVVAREYWGTEE